MVQICAHQIVACWIWQFIIKRLQSNIDGQDEDHKGKGPGTVGTVLPGRSSRRNYVARGHQETAGANSCASVHSRRRIAYEHAPVTASTCRPSASLSGCFLLGGAHPADAVQARMKSNLVNVGRISYDGLLFLLGCSRRVYPRRTVPLTFACRNPSFAPFE